MFVPSLGHTFSQSHISIIMLVSTADGNAWSAHGTISSVQG